MPGMSLGEIFIALRLDDKEFRAGLQRAKGDAERAASDIEKGANVSGQKQLRNYDKFLSEKDSLRQKNVRNTNALNEKESKDAFEFQKRMNQQRLAEELRFHKENRSYIEKTMESSKNILAAAPGFALATAAISGVYVALRAVRDEFTAGLAAVEDYQLKVASMSAFLTTFDKNLTKTNASDIYKSANVEAQKIVKTMEVLDARTIATGKDLTTMAEQFIKGGVKIDTANKASMDGFVNIANALKLLTQGQNQEIQMRQEIRALTQGQVRDQNIVVQTLKGVDPQIKEHIKLWKQQGTVLENVGQLLAGFGPAAKDLEKTWAVVGSTMETIHTRILRDAFKPTYDSLVQTAKAWNSALMNTDGTLTTLATSLSKVTEFTLNFVSNLLKIVAIVAVGGPIILGISAIGGAVSGLTLSINGLTASLMKNPITAGLILVSMGLTIKSISDMRSESDKLATSLDGIKPPNKENEAWSFFPWLIGKLSQAVSLAKELSGEVSSSEFRATRQLKEMQTRQAPTISSGNILDGVFPSIEGTMSKSEINEQLKDFNKNIEALERQALKVKDSARATLEAEIANGRFAASFKELRDGGLAANDTLDEAIAKSRKLADTIDSNKLGEKSKQQWDSASKSIEGTITSLRSMNLEQEKSQEAIWRSRFASESYRKELGMSVEQFDKFKKAYSEMVFAEAEAADQRKATQELAAYVNKLKEKIETLKGGKTALVEYQIEQGLISEALKRAGGNAEKFREELEKLKNEYKELVFAKEMQEMEKTFLSLQEKFLTGEEKIQAQYEKNNHAIDDLIRKYEEYVNAGGEANEELLNRMIDLYDKEKELRNKSLGDWEIANTAKGKSFKKLADGVYESLSSAFEKLFDKGENAFKNFFDGLKNLFKKMIADMAAQALARPIIVPIVSAIGGAMGVSGNAQASVLEQYGITGTSGTTMAGSLAVLGGTAALGSMMSGPNTTNEALTSAGVGLAGTALEAYGSTGGQLSSTLLGSLQDRTAEYVSTNLSAELGAGISDLSSSAFSGWAAGIGTFVIGLLRGEGFKTAALKGVGAGLGAWGGAAAGTAAGASVGGTYGWVLGPHWGGCGSCPWCSWSAACLLVAEKKTLSPSPSLCPA